ncbi:MAG: hypothetical protein ABSH19_02760 [Opitutales bacterium]|jgi:hypothetical protein
MDVVFGGSSETAGTPATDSGFLGSSGGGSLGGLVHGDWLGVVVGPGCKLGFGPLLRSICGEVCLGAITTPLAGPGIGAVRAAIGGGRLGARFIIGGGGFIGGNRGGDIMGT